LDGETIQVLRAHRARQLKERLACGAGWVDTGLVFTLPNGEGLHSAQVTNRFGELTAAAGLPPIRLHDLRHGAATLALAAGVGLKVVQAMLRHSSLSITADTYTSVLPEVAHAAAEAAARLVLRLQLATNGRTTDAPAGAAWQGPPQRLLGVNVVT
jgi:integrase